MKRFIISLVILGLVLGLSLYGTRFVTSTYEQIDDALTQGEELMDKGSYDKAKEHCSKAEKIFEKREPFLAAFVNHSILDEIGERVASVSPLADKESIPEFKSNCSEAKIALRHMRNDHVFILGNLF